MEVNKRHYVVISKPSMDFICFDNRTFLKEAFMFNFPNPKNDDLTA
jgi:hypothetical protein